MPELPEKVTCPKCNVFMGLIRSDGTGPVLNCSHQNCALAERLAPYQPKPKAQTRITSLPQRQPQPQPQSQKDEAIYKPASDMVCNCGTELNGSHDHVTCGPPVPRDEPEVVKAIEQLETDGAPPLE